MMEKAPSVTVIIPNYNHSSFLKERIESVLHQSFNDFEIILMDDCSSDNSRDILSEYENYEKVSAFLFNHTNSGSTFKQWEKGINEAKGKYIWIAESDDTADIDFLTKAVQILDSDDKISLVFCKSTFINENGDVIAIEDTQASIDKNFGDTNYVMNGNDFIIKFLRHLNVIPNASAVVFRKDMLQYGIFKDIKSMKYAGDWLFWTKLIQHNYVGYISESKNNFRFHQLSTRGVKPVSSDIDRIRECFKIINIINFEYKCDLSTVKLNWLYSDWIDRVQNRDNNPHFLFYPPFKITTKYLLILIKMTLKLFLKKVSSKV